MVGAGSLSFQMIEALVERLPVMVCPRWVATLTQPLAVDDVVQAYSSAALELPDSAVKCSRSAVQTSSLRGHHAYMRLAAPLAAAGAIVDAAPVGPLAALVTPAQARVGRALVEGLKNPTVVDRQQHSTRSRSNRHRCAWRWRRR